MPGRAGARAGSARRPSRRSTRTLTKAAISTAASVGPSTSRARRSSAQVDERTRPHRLRHDARARRLGAEGEGRQQVGADVEGEDLQHGQGEREVPDRQRPQHEGRQLGDVVGEVVGQEATDVRTSGPAELDRGHDRLETVVEQHDVGRLAGDLGARGSHRDADVGRAQGGSVVDAVAGHRHDVPARLQGDGDPELVLRRDAGDDGAVDGRAAPRAPRRRRAGRRPSGPCRPAGISPTSRADRPRPCAGGRR